MVKLLILAATFAAPSEAADEGDSRRFEEIRVPADAEERPAKGFAPDDRWSAHKFYVLDDKIVAERLYFANGNLAEEKIYGNFEEHKLHGIWRQYHWNGKLAAERPYRNGQMDGVFRFFDEDGQLLGESKIMNGSGVLREFENKLLLVSDKETPYQNGKIHGKVTHWAKFSGWPEPAVEVSQYVCGKIDGWSYIRDANGSLLESAFFKDGHVYGVVRSTDRNGKSLEDFPKYYIDGNRVSESGYKEAAESDKLLKEIMEFKPPQHDKVPEAPTKVAARKKAAEKAKSRDDRKNDGSVP